MKDFILSSTSFFPSTLIPKIDIIWKTLNNQIKCKNWFFPSLCLMTIEDSNVFILFSFRPLDSFHVKTKIKYLRCTTFFPSLCHKKLDTRIWIFFLKLTSNMMIQFIFIQFEIRFISFFVGLWENHSGNNYNFHTFFK